MIKEVTMFTVICDRCGTDSCEDAEYVAWATLDQAVDVASESDWLIDSDGKHYCENCHRWDEEMDVEAPLPPLLIKVEPEGREDIWIPERDSLRAWIIAQGLECIHNFVPSGSMAEPDRVICHCGRRIEKDEKGTWRHVG